MNTEYKKYLAMSVLAAVIIAGVLIFFKSCTEAPAKEAGRAYDVARRFAKDCAEVLQFRPVIMVNQEVVFDRAVPIAELALAEKTFIHTYTWEQTWLRSTKKLSLQGTFRAKGGYDLTKPFVVIISEDGKSVSATVPEVQVLSVELQNEKIVSDENGWWNNISTEDREAAKNALLREARAKARASSLRSEVEEELQRKLRGLLQEDEISLSVLANAPVLR